MNDSKIAMMLKEIEDLGRRRLDEILEPSITSSGYRVSGTDAREEPD